MNNPKILIHNSETDQTIEREMTNDEYQNYLKIVKNDGN
jgi:hypothetical protein